MFCKQCGAEVSNDANHCEFCGCPINKSRTVEISNSTAPKKTKNGFAIAGFVCSFFIPILGWVFGGIGIKKSKELDGKGKGLAIAALIIATVTFIYNWYIFRSGLMPL